MKIFKLKNLTTNILILFISNFLFSQDLSISGELKDEFNIPVVNASIIIYHNNKVLAYTYSKDNGKYNILLEESNIKKNTTVKIEVNILGFQKQNRIINITNDKVYTVNFKLYQKTEELDEVVLEAWDKMKIKKDTILFRASAFKNGSERVVDDLLKNLPGVEITNNGIIKVNGQAIDKLLIEGDDLFDEKYKLLSKNLAVNNIKEVEILTNFEDNPVLKSFQNSEKVAINLKVTDNKKNIWFGNGDVGYGSDDRFNTSFNIGLLKKRFKFFNLINANSTGNIASNQINNKSVINLNGLQTKQKIEKTNNEIVNIDNIASTSFSNNEDIFNKSLLNSLSFLTNLSKNTQLRSLSYFTYDDISKQNNKLTEFIVNPEIISFSEINKIDINDLSFATEFELKHKSSNKSYLTYDFTLEKNTAETRGNLIFNNDSISQIQNDNNFNFFNHLNLTKKLSDKTLMLGYAYFGLNSTKQNYTIEPNIFSDIFSNDDKLTINQRSNTPSNYYGIISELISKGKTSKYGIELSATVDNDIIDTDFRYIDQTSIDSLSNNTNFKNTKFSITGKYDYDISKFLKLKSSLSVSQNILELNKNFNSFVFVNPKIKLNTKKLKVGNFGASYSYQNNLPESQFLTNSFVLTNYRTFNRGNEIIQQINNHSFNFFYTLNNFKKQFLIYSFLNHSFTDKSYSFNSLITEQTNFNQYELISGGRQTSYILSITKFLKKFKSSIKISTQQNWTNAPIILNNTISSVVNYNANYRLQGTTYFKLPVNFKFGIAFNYSKADFNNQTTTNNFLEGNLDSFLKLSENFLINLENNYYNINNINYLFTNLNFSLNPKKGKFSYQLSINNLTNINEFRDVLISEFQRNETTFRILPRYLLLNLKYIF